jgi:hypothetical protein
VEEKVELRISHDGVPSLSAWRRRSATAASLNCRAQGNGV